jgi:hypothetical protein
MFNGVKPRKINTQISLRSFTQALRKLYAAQHLSEKQALRHFTQLYASFTQALRKLYAASSKFYATLRSSNQLYAVQLQPLIFIQAQVLVLSPPPLLHVQRNGRLPAIHLSQSRLMCLSLTNHGKIIPTTVSARAQTFPNQKAAFTL